MSKQVLQEYNRNLASNLNFSKLYFNENYFRNFHRNLFVDMTHTTTRHTNTLSKNRMIFVQFNFYPQS